MAGEAGGGGAPIPPLNFNSASSAQTGPISAMFSSPWNQGDVVLTTGGSSSSAIKSAAGPLADIPLQYWLIGAIVGAVLWKKYK